MKKNIAYLAFCGILVSLLTACGGKTSKSEVPVITVTIEPQRYFTEAIAGDKFKVVSIVPKGSSPETYDPVPQQLVSLSESRAYLRIGHIGFEMSWMDRLVSNTPHLQVFDTSKDIDLIISDDHCTHYHDDGTFHTHGVDPHVWNSTTNAFILARNTYEALVTLDKENQPYYFARYDSLCRKIQETHDRICEKLLGPDITRTFMIYHPALSYFARDYGLQQIAIEENGKEPSPAHLKKLIDICKKEKVRIIFIQPEFDQSNAETIARQTGARIVPVNPLNYDWPNEMLRTADILAGKFRESL